MTDRELISELEALADKASIARSADREPYLTEWRHRWPGESPLILAPGSVQELSTLVRFCNENGIGITPQGGNTGLVGGQMPQGEVLISTKRLRKVREVSPDSNSITVEAGVTLAETQAAANKVDRLFPLSIGSEGTCQIGGIVSTNAGGVNVIKYGNTRDLVLGLEVVLPSGEIWNGLGSLRKDNTGYDLKQLFIGAEGTLGIVTAAALKLFPKPCDVITAYAAVPNAMSAVNLLNFMQDGTGGLATSFELISENMQALVLKNINNMQRPLAAPSPWYVLMEFSAGRHSDLSSTAEALLADAFEKRIVTDATVATNKAQSEKLWALRHNASAAMSRDGAACVKCDISVPIAEIPSFLKKTDRAVHQLNPLARIIAFGHIGDGNIHYDVLGPEDSDQGEFEAQHAKMQMAIHNIAVDHNGSISAEHGIGLLKRDELKQRKSKTEMQMMQAIKQAIDPKGTMNPGKLL